MIILSSMPLFNKQHVEWKLKNNCGDVDSSEHCLKMEIFKDSGGYGALTGATLAQLTSDQKI